MTLRISRALGPAAMAVAVVLALILLQHQLNAYHYRDLMRQVWTLPHSHLALALVVTAVAYAVLPGYDAIALAYVDHPLPIRRIAFGSFIAYALSHSLGFPLLSGGPVRYRFWSVWGLSTSEIGQAISFSRGHLHHRNDRRCRRRVPARAGFNYRSASSPGHHAEARRCFLPPADRRVSGPHHYAIQDVSSIRVGVSR